VAHLRDNAVKLDEQRLVLLLVRIAVKREAGRDELLVEGSEQRQLDHVRDRHVVLDRVEAAESQVEEADLGVWQGREKPVSPAASPNASSAASRASGTYDAGEVSIKLLDDRRERARRQVEEGPAVAHRLAVPARRGVLRRRGDVAPGLVPDRVL
jgi:hypothetical protein